MYASCMHLWVPDIWYLKSIWVHLSPGSSCGLLWYKVSNGKLHTRCMWTQWQRRSYHLHPEQKTAAVWLGPQAHRLLGSRNGKSWSLVASHSWFLYWYHAASKGTSLTQYHESFVGGITAGTVNFVFFRDWNAICLHHVSWSWSLLNG